MKTYDILVAGEINPDLILKGDVLPEFGQAEKLVEAASLEVGSSSVIFACGAARLGLKVAFVGVCGEDLFGRYMLGQMSARGVDISPVIVDPSRRTGLTVILDRGEDRAMLTFPGCIPDLAVDQISTDLLHASRHLHIASYFLQTRLQPGLPHLFQQAHQLGLTLSLDPNWDPSGEWLGFERLFPLLDVFLPNEKEALAISGRKDAQSALRHLNEKTRVVAVKRGKSGAIAGCGGEIVSAPAVKVDVVDTVGAGDTFDAGFLYGWLNGWSLDRSLAMGAACGSLSTRSTGGTAAQPALEEVLPYVPPAG